MATSIRLDPLAQKAIRELKSALEQEEGHRASQEEIVSALVFGATPSQTAGMLIAFTKASAQRRASVER